MIIAHDDAFAGKGEREGRKVGHDGSGLAKRPKPEEGGMDSNIRG
jgi:hypothetical protein